MTGALLSQAPALIPYQAVARNASGQPLGNTVISARFTLREHIATGASVWQEVQSVSTNALGLFNAQLGSVSPLTNVNWGNGSKFMQVEINTGNGFVDIGTQQMLSVPYALHSSEAQNGYSHVSMSGDTLYFQNGSFVIIPGLSIRNGPEGNTGAALLPGNDTCDDQYISVTGCGGQTTITYDDRVYDLVEIGGQCWFAENLATDQYRNGDAIPTGLTNEEWINAFDTQQGATAVYNDDANNDSIYGKLYNFYAVKDARGLCPSGWHVPTDCEWMYLEASLGMSPWTIETSGVRGTDQGSQLKSSGTIEEGTGLWHSPNVGATNNRGFSGLPGGARNSDEGYYNLGIYGYWWCLNQYDSSSAFLRFLLYDWAGIWRSYYEILQEGLSVRCLRD
jgi:uncharacterized protein (TIGR02145 family)